MISLIICVLPKILLGAVMRENEMGGTSNAHKGMRNWYIIIVKCLKTRSTCKI